MKKLLQRLGLIKKPAGKATVTAVLIKADGTRVDLGKIAEGDVAFAPRKE